MIDEERLKRYIEKINHIEKRVSEFEEWKVEFFEDEKTKLACYKAIQEAIEACLDVVAMMVKDYGMLPKDDYRNIELIEDKVISNELANALKELNGLRNRIVHEYNGLNDEIAMRSIENLIPSINEFLDQVREWLEKKIR